MAIRSFQGNTPCIAASAYIDELALIIGAVEIGEHSSVWPMCVVRGDVQRIRIGARTSIQDGSVVHVTHDSRSL
jgi:carbonic anhydrase/acetyltransferase-like protein (isoleucine patch superfamily)